MIIYDGKDTKMMDHVPGCKTTDRIVPPALIDIKFTRICSLRVPLVRGIRDVARMNGLRQ